MKRVLAISGVLLACVFVALLAVRIPKTVEYRIYRGDTAMRIELCRSIPNLHPRRQTRLVLRLLADPSADVRSGAVTAAERCPAQPRVQKRLLEIVLDANETDFIREKAGLVLLSGDSPERSEMRAYLYTLPHAAAGFPELMARQRIADYMQAFDPKVGARLVDQAIDPHAAAAPFLREWIRNERALRPDLQAHILNRLAELENRKDAFELRRFLMACLRDLHGDRRQAPAAALEPETPDGIRIEGDVIEAEWAVDIRANYQIDMYQGRRCLTLGVGGGGIVHWLKGEHGSTDIGRARLSCHIPENGRYQVWARVFLEDKCANSFGFYFAGKRFGGFSDHTDTFGEWHWLPLHPEGAEDTLVSLERGFHPIRLEAWEDGVYLDKFAVLKPGVEPEQYDDTNQLHWDSSLLPDISFSPERQSMCRGSRQKMTVWVRRNAPDMRQGRIWLHAQAPFRIISANPVEVQFEPGAPLARAEFEIELPADATAGETLLRTWYMEDGGDDLVESRMILGVNYQWLGSGPLKADDERHRRWLNATHVTDDEIRDAFIVYPADGYDPYRRLTPKTAWGATAVQGAYMYFVTDIDVDESGDYVIMLTADDQATVWIDGDLLIAQPRNGPAEGRMVTLTKRIDAGRRRLFVRLSQADFPDPVGVAAFHRNMNHCALKLLLRRQRHELAPEIRSRPMTARFTD